MFAHAGCADSAGDVALGDGGTAVDGGTVVGVDAGTVVAVDGGTVAVDGGAPLDDAGAPDAASPVDALFIYAASGDTASATHSGLDPAAPTTVENIQDAVAPHLARGLDIYVRIAPGTYTNVDFVWALDHTMSANRIVFMPWVDGDVFDSDAFVTFEWTDHNPRAFFRLVNDSDTDRATNLVFFHLRISGYWQGIVLQGSDSIASGIEEPGAVTHNAIVDCRFENIGALFFPDTVGHGFSAVGLTNSDHNVVRYNWFTAVENRAADGPELLHALYLAHNASNNEIMFNAFERVSGDPIRLRDFCNDNRIRGNVFVYSGADAMVGDWYQNAEVVPAYMDSYAATGRYECPSWENEVLYNYYNKSYYDSANQVGYQRTIIPIAETVRPESSNLTCPAGTSRFRTSAASNYQSSTPSVTRAHRDDWATLREQWIQANLYL